MNREEWQEHWDWYTSLPIADVMAVRTGCTPDELPELPGLEGVETIGDLAAMDFAAFWNAYVVAYNEYGDEQKMAACVASEALRREKQRATFLPVIADLALSGRWKEFSERVQSIYEVMPEAFELFYPDMPERYRRDFVIGCYEHHGDSVEACRRAVIELPASGLDELPAELAGKERITVYRAGLEGIDETPDFISWTTSLDVARFFQRRHRGGSIYRASIRPCDVIAYNDGRDEYEVLQYRGVFDVEEMEPERL